MTGVPWTPRAAVPGPVEVDETARPEIVDSGSVRDGGSRPAVLTRDQQLSKSLLGGKSFGVFGLKNHYIQIELMYHGFIP